MRRQSIRERVKGRVFVVGDKDSRPAPSGVARRRFVSDDFANHAPNLLLGFGGNAPDGNSRMWVGGACRHKPIVAGSLAQMGSLDQVRRDQVLVGSVEVIAIVIAGFPDE